MDQRLKERLFGAFIVISLFVIFLPMILKEPAVESILEREPIPEPVLDVEDHWMKPPEPLSQWQQSIEEQKTKAPSVWAVQLATFADRENAQKLADKLKAKGYQAFLESVPGQSSQLTWVLVGQEQEKNQALELQATLNAKFKLKGLVVPYEPKS